MRKGFALIQMLSVIITLPVIMLLYNGLFRTLFHEIPHASGVVQENTTLLHLLRHIAEDIDNAKQLSLSPAGQAANPNTLLIEHQDATITYEFKNGKATRREPTGSRRDATVWSIPNAEIKWRILRRDGAGYALEVKTHIKHFLREKPQKKMANSHLYFVEGL